MNKFFLNIVFIVVGLMLVNFSCNNSVDEKSLTQSKAIDSSPSGEVIQFDRKMWTELSPDEFKGIRLNEDDYRKFKIFKLDSIAMQTALRRAGRNNPAHKDASRATIEIPSPDGVLMETYIYETSTMDSALAARYPELKTYGGKLLAEASSMIRLDFNTNGFHAFIQSEKGEWFIQPAKAGITHQFLICFYKQDWIAPRQPFEVNDSTTK